LRSRSAASAAVMRLEAAQVVVPGRVDDLLDEAAGFAEVAQQLPRQRAVAQPAAAALQHQRAEFIGARRVDAVFDGHHHLAGGGRLVGFGRLELRAGVRSSSMAWCGIQRLVATW
jgi:hypothetical protein